MASATAGWGRPFPLTTPRTLDILPPQVVFSPAGASAVAFGIQDVDDPATSVALATVRDAAGRVGRSTRIGDAQQVLDMTYQGASLEALVGTSPRGQSCCSSVKTARSAGAGFARPRQLLDRLAGSTNGRLLTIAGRLLAVIGTDSGVWVAQSTAGSDHFGPTRQLTDPSALPTAIDASVIANQESTVAWSTNTGESAIWVARGTPQHAPTARRVAVTLAAGHEVDELAVTAGPTAPTVAWIEGWYDAGGNFRSQLMVADLSGSAQPKAVTPISQLASGVALASDGAGDQELAWKACSSSGACSVSAALRPAHKSFGRAQQLGSIDPSGSPAPAVASDGAALLGWIRNGHVLAAGARAASTSFGTARVVSSTNYAADLTLGVGPVGQALAAWTQGTVVQTVIGAVYRPR